MTGAEFSGVDIDLLADFVGGVLDGTPDEVLVARRIADNAAWQEAYVELSAGVGAVSAALKAWGHEPEPMPADVVARLDEALLAPVAPETSNVVPLEPRRAKVRRLKWAAPIGIAAAAVTFLGVGVQQMNSSDSADDDTTAAGSAPEAATLAAVPVQTESGIDYTQQTLGQVAARPLVGSNEARISGQDQPGDAATSKAATDDGALRRLRVAEALHACLDAITGEHDAGPITVQTVDYARFQGSPALVVHFTATNGTWVWAVGSDCGSPGSGTDELASVRVG